MASMLPFLFGVGSIVAGIIVLKVFFTLWRVQEQKLDPEKFSKPTATFETAFRGLKGKRVVLHLKNGEILEECTYKSTLLFGTGDGEFNTCTLVYFELEKPDKNRVYLCGSDILKIETTSSVEK